MILRPFKYRDLRPGDMVVYGGIGRVASPTLLVRYATPHAGGHPTRWTLTVHWIRSDGSTSTTAYPPDADPPSHWYRVAREGET